MLNRRLLTLGQGVGSLLSLFANGEDGFLFGNFADLTKLFTTSGGSTNVAANDDPVGRAVDSSPNGKNGTQATTTQRPLWKANSGKPYLAWDATDDALTTSFQANGSGLTMAVAMRTSNNQVMLGGGITTGNKRAYIGLDNSGFVNVGWGTAVNEGANDRRNTDITIVVTGDGTGRDVWINGVLTTWGAVSGAPDGTGGGVALGALNNNGTLSNYASGRLYAALARNKRSNPAEIAFITSQFQRTYQ